MDFRELLGTTFKRRLDLLELLYYQRKGWTVTQLLDELDCSLPVLMADIEKINMNNPDFTIIKLNGHYHLEIDETASLSNLYASILIWLPEYQIIEELLYEECETISDLAEKLQLSLSKTQRHLKKIKAALHKAGMTLASRPLRVEGREGEVRNFYFRFYLEQQDTFENILPKLTEHHYLIIERYVQEFARINGMQWKYIYEKRLIFNFYISLWRIKNNHFFPKYELRTLGLKLPSKNFYLQLDRAVKEIALLDLSVEVLRDCFWLNFSDALVYNASHREYALMDNPRYQYLFVQHHELVTSYDEMLGCRLSKQDKINYTTILCNDVYLYDSKDAVHIDLLWDNRLFFLHEAAKVYGNGIEKVKGLVETFVKKHRMYQEEGFVYNYMYLLITMENRSLKWLASQDQALKILLLSDLTPTAEAFLAHQIQELVYGNFTIHHFEKLSASADQLHEEMTKYDCLITTRSTRGIANEFPAVVIPPFLTLEGIQDIQELIADLMAQKNNSAVS